MPAETQCNDLQRVYVSLKPDGELDGPPVWSVVSGNGLLEEDPSGPSWDPALPEGYQMYLRSEDNVPGPGPFDTLYHVEAMAGGGVVPGDNDILLHVINNPTSSLGIAFGAPETK